MLRREVITESHMWRSYAIANQINPASPETLNVYRRKKCLMPYIDTCSCSVIHGRYLTREFQRYMVLFDQAYLSTITFLWWNDIA